MFLIIHAAAKNRFIRPFRKIALFFARRWPFPVQSKLVDGSAMWVDLRSAVGRAIFVKGAFDYEVWKIIETRLAAGSVFIDVGANVGYYSMLASNLVGSTGKVHAFDIDPRPLKCLRKNSKECEYKNIDIHEVAVGGDVGFGVLVSMPDCGHSVVRKTGLGKKVPMVSLDRWMSSLAGNAQIDVVKIDIEGGELAALEGARKMIERHRPLIVCEAQDDASDATSERQTPLLKFFAEVNYSTRYAAGVHTPTIVATPNL